MMLIPLLLLTLCGMMQFLCSSAQYNQDLALQYVKIAGAAYCLPNEIESWTCPQCTADVTSVKVCESTSSDKTHAFVGRWKDGCVLSFEGTETAMAMLIDLELYNLKPLPILNQVCNNCSVHPGYLWVWDHLRECIVQKLRAIGCNKEARSPLRITGHSLGAGVAGIAMTYLEHEGWNIVESYNFGMPRTGDEAFVTNFTSMFAKRFYRVTHHKDPIIQLPPDKLGPINFTYAHVEPEVFYDGDPDQGYTICNQHHDVNCSAKYWDVLNWDLTFHDHLTYLGVPLGRGPCGWNQSVLV